MLTLIAALGRNRELGKGNDLLWKIPSDLRRFKDLTLGHPIIMGRKTFDSLPKRPLPGRSNVVITRDASWAHEGVTRASSIEEAIAAAQTLSGSEEVFVIGGAQIYALALPHADRLLLTEIDAGAPDADAVFPEYTVTFPKQVSRESGEEQGIRFDWVEYRK